MSSISMLVLLSSALYIKCIDKDVVILNTSGVVANQAVSQCGRNLTLTCKFKKNTFAIVWKNANDICSIATCIQNNCTLDPAYYGQNSISFDMRQGIFDLTVINVTMKDNGRKLVCSDGSHTDFTIIAVRDYSLDLIEDRHTGTITVTSGCVSKDTKVLFIWMEKDACRSIESQFSPKVRFKRTTSCSNDSVCGNIQHIRYIEEIFISPNQYQLIVIAVYGHESKESDEIVVKYLIPNGEKRSCYIQDKPSRVLIICIAAAGGGFGIILSFMLNKSRCKMVGCQFKKLCIKQIAKRPKTQRDNVQDRLKQQTKFVQVSKEKEEIVEEEGGEDLSLVI